MNHHIIYRQKATITVAQEANARAIQNEMGDVIKYELPQLLQDVFDSIVPEGNIIRIDTLQLDLGTLPAQNMKQVFKERIAEKIRTAIVLQKEAASFENGVAGAFNEHKQHENFNGVVITDKEHSLREAFLYFLQHGMMPWFMSIKSRKEWESALQQGFTKSDWQKIVLWLRQNHEQQPIVIERLVYQFSDDLLAQVIKNTVFFGDEEWKDIYRDLHHFTTKDRVQLLSLCMFSFLKETSLTDALYRVVKTALQSDNPEGYETIETANNKTITTGAISKVIERLKLEEKPPVETYSEGKKEVKEDIISSQKNAVGNAAGDIDSDNPLLQKEQLLPGNRSLTSNLVKSEPQYVNNCGIVLLHPFLKMYFAEFDLLYKKKFKDEDARKRAVMLLHYLATGETEGEEWNLLLQKMLCGLSFEETLPDRIEITGKEKEESERVLQSVINYCPPLKNTSLAGLRSTFLQRDGRLEKKENGWLLTIEQKTVDVLLNKIPWGFSTIKFPWLNDMINVDWC